VQVRGVLTRLQDELTSRVAMATAGGYRVEMHVIGDRAVDVALNALRDSSVPVEKRPVFIHCQVQAYRLSAIPTAKFFVYFIFLIGIFFSCAVAKISFKLIVMRLSYVMLKIKRHFLFAHSLTPK